jgi:hypothetical protein
MVYSHDQLEAELGISSSNSRKVGRSAQLNTSDAASSSSAAAPAVRPTSSQHTAAGAQAAATSVADSFQRPSACLAQLADQVPVLYSQVEYSTLQALAAISSASSSFEAYDLPPASLLGGGTGPFSQLLAEPPDDGCSPHLAWQQQQLRAEAARCVNQVSYGSNSSTAAAAQHLPGSYVGPADSSGIKATRQLNTACVSSSFFPAALTDGVTLYEPFGGLCAGLEMVLRAGISVKQYLYSDSDMTAQRIAQHRVRLLQTQYPSL